MTSRKLAIKLLGRLSPILPTGPRFKIRLLQQRYGQPIEPELLELPNILRRFHVSSGLAVDVGSNHGLWTFELAKWFDRVLAIEANPRLAEGLARIAPHNCRVIPLGLSDGQGSLEFFIPEVEGMHLDGWASFDKANCPDAQDWISQIVPIDTLENVLADQKPSFLKMDVEGHEFRVLKGAGRLIESTRPILMIEVKERLRVSVLELLTTWGYRPWRLQELCGTPGSPENLFFIPVELE